MVSYCVSVALLIIATALIVKRLCFRWQKVLIVLVSCLLLFSAIWHTKFYASPAPYESYLTAGRDQEVYFRSAIAYKLVSLFHNLLSLKLDSADLPSFICRCIIMLFFLGGRLSLECFFFCCILASVSFLLISYLLLKIFSALHLNGRDCIIGCLIFFSTSCRNESRYSRNNLFVCFFPSNAFLHAT